MCPICMSVAAAVLAGTGSAGGVATLLATKWRRHRRGDAARATGRPAPNIDLQPNKAGGKP